LVRSVKVRIWRAPSKWVSIWHRKNIISARVRVCINETSTSFWLFICWYTEPSRAFIINGILFLTLLHIRYKKCALFIWCRWELCITRNECIFSLSPSICVPSIPYIFVFSLIQCNTMWVLFFMMNFVRQFLRFTQLFVTRIFVQFMFFPWDSDKLMRSPLIFKWLIIILLFGDLFCYLLLKIIIFCLFSLFKDISFSDCFLAISKIYLSLFVVLAFSRSICRQALNLIIGLSIRPEFIGILLKFLSVIAHHQKHTETNKCDKYQWNTNDNNSLGGGRSSTLDYWLIGIGLI
jgi:hypothetical protein